MTIDFHQDQVKSAVLPITRDAKKALRELAKIEDELAGRDLNSVYIRAVGDRITFTNKNWFNRIFIWVTGLFSKNEEYNFERNINTIAKLFNKVSNKEIILTK